MAYIYLIIAGIVGGFIAGLIGIGGGTIYVFVIPDLLKQWGVPQNEIAPFTIANSLAAIFFASLAAGIKLKKLNMFYMVPVLKMTLCTVLASILTFKYIVNTGHYSHTVFNSIVIFIMGIILIKTLLPLKGEFNKNPEQLSWGHLVVTGTLAGTVAALSGLGGGIIIVPLVQFWGRVDIKKASAFSTGVILFTSLISSFYNAFSSPLYSGVPYSMGYIVFPIVALLAMSVTITSPLGVKWAQRWSPKTLNYIYAAILFLVIVKKIFEIY